MNEISCADIIARTLFDMPCPPIVHLSDLRGYITTRSDGISMVGVSIMPWLGIVGYDNFYLETEPDRFTECFLLEMEVIDGNIIMLFTAMNIWSL